MAVSFVRVTLDEPARNGDPFVTMHYGTDEATVPVVLQSDDYVNDVNAPAPRIIPGKPIAYHLEVGSPIVMAAFAAMHYFGNWEIPMNGAIPGHGGEGKVEFSYAYEKRRVGRLWGDYGTMTRTEAGGDGRQNGFRNLPKTSVPPVPHVTIEMLDANMHGTGGLYRPHEKFLWQNDLSKQRPLAPPEAVRSYSEADMQAMVERMVADRLEKMLPQGKGKAS